MDGPSKMGVGYEDCYWMWYAIRFLLFSFSQGKIALPACPFSAH